jgi:hypothetical protein
MKNVLLKESAWGIGSISTLILLFLFSAKVSFAQFNLSVEGPITITSSAYDMTVGNFDNTGRPEAIVTHAQNYNNTTPSSSNIVTYIKYNTATSTWESTIIENTGGYAGLAITSGDYDSDGNRDFAFTANCNCGNYYLYKGDGADGFTNATPTFSGNRFSYDMVTGELNNDGKPDILTGGNTVLSRFLNTSTGIGNFSFSKISFIIASSDNSSYGYSIADFNNDGFNDIVSSIPAEAKVRVQLNDGVGGFNSAVYTDYTITGSSTSNIRGVTTGDFNDDGYMDIVAASYNGNAIGVLINSADGSGTFDPVVLYTLTTPKWVEVGDIDGDGFLDIVVAASNISIFKGNGDGTFATAPYTFSLAGVNRLDVADMNNDGRDDIAAITSSTFRVLISCTPYNLTETATVCSGDSYLFPDGTTETNITAQVIHVSNLQTTLLCDSIITTTVNVNPVYDLTETATVCSGDSYLFPDGTTETNITAQVIHVSNLQTTLLCDSIITTTVNVNPVYNLTENATVCSGDSYLFPDGTTETNITAQVIHVSNLQTTMLCDSIITTTVNVNPVYDLTETATVCSGDSYLFPDGTTETNITAQVIHVSNLQTTLLCDSIITTTVNVNPVYDLTETATVCSGDSYLFPDGTTETNITAQVIHVSNLQTTMLCDSIITTTVNVNPVYDLTETATVCSGDSYLFPDGTTETNITAQVIHVSNLQTTLLCDSIITTTVNVNPVYDLTETATVCSGDSYLFPDGTTETNITAQVIHVSNLQTTLLCDSIITTTVDVTDVDVTVSQNGATLTANATGAAYQWLDCGNGLSSVTGETSQIFTATVNGNYAVEVEQSGCIDTSACYAITTIGILESDFGSAFIVYPNPTSGNLAIVLGESYDDVTVVVRNSVGQEIAMQNFKSTSQIDLEIFGDKGYYLIEITTKSGKAARIKVLKI